MRAAYGTPWRPALRALLAVALTTPALAAQSRDTSVRLVPDAVVDVTVRSGRLTVRGIDGSIGSVRGSTGDYQLRSSGVSLTLTAQGESASRGALEIDLPRGVRIVVSTRSADVAVRDIRGGVEVQSTSGDVRLEDVGGRVIVETISGNVAISGGTHLRVGTVSGELRLRDARGDIALHTTSGNVTVSGSGIARLDAESMSGDVRLEGGLGAAARVRVNTHSGDVVLQLPEAARGRLSHSTVNGELSAGGPLTLLPGTVTGGHRGRGAQQYEFGGDAKGDARGLQIDISTFSGSVRLLRALRF